MYSTTLTPSSEDKRDHEQLARSIANATNCPIAVPNYRLTNTLQEHRHRHPVHAQDLLLFLHFLIHWDDPPVKFTQLVLIGHSCSAHMLSSIFLDSDSVSPTLSPQPALLSAVKGIIMSEGIYDLESLLVRFPTYRDWFIEPAFGPHQSYAPFSVLNFPLRHSQSDSISWLILHSRGDSLVDLPQSTSMHTHLTKLDPDHSFINIDDLIGEHNDILRSPVYVDLVKDFSAKFL